MIDESVVDFVDHHSLGSREATFDMRTPEMMRRKKGGKEFAPLLHTQRQSTRHLDKGILSFDENQNDSLESFGRSASAASFIQNDENIIKRNSQIHNSRLLNDDLKSMPLKEQENVMKSLQHENWSLKCKIVVLEQQLAKGIPENQQEIVAENIRLKADIQSLKMRMVQLQQGATGKRNDESTEYQTKIDELQGYVDMYKNKVNKLEDEMEDLRYDQQRTEEEKDKLEQDLEKAREEREERGDGNDGKQELEDEIEDLRHELRQVTQEKEELEAQAEERPREHSESDSEPLRQELAAKVQELEESQEVYQRQVERIQQLQKEKKQLEEQVDQLSNSNLDDQLFEVQQEKRAVQRELDDRVAQLEAIQKDHDNLRTKYDRTNKDLTEVQNELANVKILMNRCNNDVLSLSNEKHELERQLADAKSSENQSRMFDESMSERKIDELERVRSELRSKEDEMATLSGQFRQEKEHLQFKLETAERLKENLDKQLQNALQDKSKETLQNAIDVEKSNHMEIKRGLEREIENLQATVKSLREETESLKKKITEQNQKMQQLQSTIDDMEDDLVVSQSEYEQMVHLRDSLQSQLEGLKTSYQSHENTLSALRDINKRETDSRLQTQAELEECEKKRQELAKQAEQFKEQKRQLEFNLESLQQKYDRVSQRLSHATDQFNETRTKLERAENERDSFVMTPRKISHSSPSSSSSSQEKLLLQIHQLQRQNKLTEYDLNHYKETASRLRQTIKQLQQQDQQESQPADIQKHKKELRGLLIQLRYLRDRLLRESAYRWDLGFMKQFFLMKISSYQACNKADLRLLENIGIYPDYSRIKKTKPVDKFRAAALAVIAVSRIRNRHADYQRQQSTRRVLDMARKGSKST